MWILQPSLAFAICLIRFLKWEPQKPHIFSRLDLGGVPFEGAGLPLQATGLQFFELLLWQGRGGGGGGGEGKPQKEIPRPVFQRPLTSAPCPFQRNKAIFLGDSASLSRKYFSENFRILCTLLAVSRTRKVFLQP